MKTILIGIFVWLLLSACVADGMAELKKMPVDDISLIGIVDGNYPGHFDFKRWFYKVTVKVESGLIADVAIEDCAYIEDKGIRKINLGLVEAVIRSQSLEFDTIGGASLHTKAFKKAVADALD